MKTENRSEDRLSESECSMVTGWTWLGRFTVRESVKRDSIVVPVEKGCLYNKGIISHHVRFLELCREYRRS